MKVKTSKLGGNALDFLATQLAYDNGAIYEDGFVYVKTLDGNRGPRSSPSTDWAQGGPLIDNFKPQFIQSFSEGRVTVQKIDGEGYSFVQHGPTTLVAVCRCFVASRLGDEVEVPEELLA